MTYVPVRDAYRALDNAMTASRMAVRYRRVSSGVLPLPLSPRTPSTGDLGEQVELKARAAARRG